MTAPSGESMSCVATPCDWARQPAWWRRFWWRSVALTVRRNVSGSIVDLSSPAAGSWSVVDDCLFVDWHLFSASARHLCGSAWGRACALSWSRCWKQISRIYDRAGTICWSGSCWLDMTCHRSMALVTLLYHVSGHWWQYDRMSCDTSLAWMISWHAMRQLWRRYDMSWACGGDCMTFTVSGAIGITRHASLHVIAWHAICASCMICNVQWLCCRTIWTYGWTHWRSTAELSEPQTNKTFIPRNCRVRNVR